VTRTSSPPAALPDAGVTDSIVGTISYSEEVSADAAEEAFANTHTPLLKRGPEERARGDVHDDHPTSAARSPGCASPPIGLAQERGQEAPHSLGDPNDDRT